MNVACPECQSVFRVDPARVVGGAVRARCNVCGGIIPVSESARWGEDFPDARLDPPRRREGPLARAGAETTPSVVASPAAGATRVPPFAPRRQTPVSSPAVFPASALRPPTPRFSPSVPPREPEPRRPTPVSPITAASPALPHPAAAPAPTRSSAPLVAPAAEVSAPPRSPAPAVAPPKRQINPFLSNDPNQKARRLARVLVSDMVAYHPEKREEGMRSGTLKQVFREEIRKSYEEYVEQVGREFSEATSHFQDALNEILAGGQRLF